MALVRIFGALAVVVVLLCLAQDVSGATTTQTVEIALAMWLATILSDWIAP